MDRDDGERFGNGERGNAASNFTALIAVPGYTREIQRKANNRIVENLLFGLSAPIFGTKIRMIPFSLY